MYSEPIKIKDINFKVSALLNVGYCKLKLRSDWMFAEGFFLSIDGLETVIDLSDEILPLGLFLALVSTTTSSKDD